MAWKLLRLLIVLAILAPAVAYAAAPVNVYVPYVDSQELTPYPTVDPRESLTGRIVFSRHRTGGAVHVYAMNADGSQQTKLTTGTDGNGPSWSPDGTRIAYVVSEALGDVYVMNADGTSPAPIVGNSAYKDYKPAWSPDGGRIVFHSFRDEVHSGPTRDYNSEIYVADLGAGTVTRLTDSAMRDENPDWSPDGSRIVFQSNRDSGDAAFGLTEIYVMNADGTDQTRLTVTSARNCDPAWSPNGQEIAYVSNLRLYIMNADGTGARRISDIYGVSAPAWSPDGLYLAFSSVHEGLGGIYVVNTLGSGSAIRLTDPAENDTGPDWMVAR